MNIGTPELILIVVLAIILYGKRLPEITRALGKGYQEFKKNVDDVKNNFQKQVEDSYQPDRLGRADATSKTDPLRGETQESSPVRDKYDAGALSGETAKENNKLIPVTPSETDSKNQDKNLAG